MLTFDGVTILTNCYDNKFLDATRRQLDALNARREDIDEQIRLLSIERDQIDEQVAALTAFLRATPSDDKVTYSESAAEPDNQPTEPDEHGHKLDNSRDEDVADIAYQVLKEAGAKDVHYVQLASEVKARGGRLPEHRASATSMLNSVLNSDPRFLRPFRRGYYSIKLHFPNVKRSVGERRNKRR